MRVRAIAHQRPENGRDVCRRTKLLDQPSDGAAVEYGLGSSIAQGMLSGNFEVTGTMKVMFANQTL